MSLHHVAQKPKAKKEKKRKAESTESVILFLLVWEQTVSTNDDERDCDQGRSMCKAPMRGACGVPPKRTDREDYSGKKLSAPLRRVLGDIPTHTGVYFPLIYASSPSPHCA